jgi:hypothetical protein
MGKEEYKLDSCTTTVLTSNTVNKNKLRVEVPCPLFSLPTGHAAAFMQIIHHPPLYNLSLIPNVVTGF